MATTKSINGERITTQVFNRFGVKKMIQFQADSGKELSFLARINSGKILKMTKEEYLELPDCEA